MLKLLPLRRFARLSLGAALAIWSAAAPLHEASAQSFQTVAPQAFLLDVDTGAVLLDVGGDALVAPASLVKLMTAELVFREIAEGRIKLDDEFTTSENAWRKGGAPAGGSSMFIVPNARVKISDLLQGLIVASGNDAAISLAEGIAGTEENFARMMTKRARELGLAKSTFVNSNGWNAPEQRVTMREMAKLSDHIIRTYPELYKIFAQRDMMWNRIKQQNRNPLLFMDMGADGLKTGFIEQSGYSLVASAVQNGQRLVLAISGLKTARDRQNEAKKILDWGFRAFEVKTLLSPGAKVGEASIYGGSQSTVGLVTRQEIRLPTPRGGSERMSAKIVYKGPVPAPIAADTEVARLHVFRGTTKVMDAPLFTESAVERGSLTQRASDAAFELGRSLIKGGFQHATGRSDSKPSEPKQAEPKQAEPKPAEPKQSEARP